MFHFVVVFGLQGLWKKDFPSKVVLCSFSCSSPYPVVNGVILFASEVCLRSYSVLMAPKCLGLVGLLRNEPRPVFNAFQTPLTRYAHRTQLSYVIV